MNHSPTEVLNALFALTDDANSIRFEESDGHAFIILDRISVSLTFSSQEALDKLATVTAQAAAANRGRTLREVA